MLAPRAKPIAISCIFSRSSPHFFLDMNWPSAYYAGNTGKEVVQGMISFRPGEVAEA
jgi:hypothetical protein